MKSKRNELYEKYFLDRQKEIKKEIQTASIDDIEQYHYSNFKNATTPLQHSYQEFTKILSSIDGIGRVYIKNGSYVVEHFLSPKKFIKANLPQSSFDGIPLQYLKIKKK